MSKEKSVVTRHQTYKKELAVNVERSISGTKRVRGKRSRLKGWTRSAKQRASTVQTKWGKAPRSGRRES
jgi:hypothetical protein